MLLEEIMRAVTELSGKERRLLLQHIGELPEQSSPLMPAERTRQLNEAMDMLGNGLSDEELEAMTAAMTEDFIEVWEESLWTQ